VRYLRHITSMLFPATCAGCGERGTWLCDRCAARIPFISSLPGLCHRCGIPQIQRQCGCRDLHPKIVSARSLYPYVDWVGASLRGIKYEGERDRAAFVGALMVGDPQIRHLIETADFVVPVPVHAQRQRQRGYNQAQLLADAACEAMDQDTSVSLLHRVSGNRSQVDLSGEDRKRNVRGAFAMAENVRIGAGRRIVIVDDVRTTGSTISACAEALKPARPSRIDVVTVAAELWPDVIRRLGIAGS